MSAKWLIALGILWSVAAQAGEIKLRPAACRLYDSRNVGAGVRITTATVETYQAPGGIQGGESGCGISAAATAAVVNLIAFDPLGPGWGRLWAEGEPEPLSTSINSTGAVNEATGLIVSVGADGKLAYHSSFQGHLIIDLAGWVEPEGVAGRLLTVAGPPDTITVQTVDGQVIQITPTDNAFFLSSWQAATAGLSSDEWVSIEQGVWRGASLFEAYSLP